MQQLKKLKDKVKKKTQSRSLMRLTTTPKNYQKAFRFTETIRVQGIKRISNKTTIDIFT